MATVYEYCTEDVKEIGDELILKYHKDLRDKGKPVEIEYVFAQLEPNENGDRPSGPAVKLHGIACYAVAKIMGAKERALGSRDARITIDKSKWELMPMPKRRALIDHELNHFMVKRDEAGIAILDAYERPRLKMRPHDHEFGWFMNIAQRHSTNSIEVEQAQRMANEAGKIYFQSEFSFAASDSLRPAASVTVKSGDKSVTISREEFSNAANGAGQGSEKIKISTDGAPPVEMTTGEFIEGLGESLSETGSEITEHLRRQGRKRLAPAA